jgi:hypothetical protein
MDTRSLMWIIFGAILVLGGIISSLTDGKNPPSKSGSRPPIERPVQERLSDERPVPAAKADKFNTGFSIDPIKGLKRKDENAEYFK